MTVKTENEKIQAAVKGQAEARKRKPTPKERATGPRIPVESLDGEYTPEQLTPVAVLESIPTDEEMDAAFEAAEKEDPVTVKTEKPKAVKTPKETTVLEDPIENQALIRMRAKWAAQRADVVVARFEKKEEEGTLTAQDRKDFAAAKKVAAAAWKLQEKELQTLRSMRTAAKGIKVEEIVDEGVGGGLQTVHPGDPSSESSSPDETAVA